MPRFKPGLTAFSLTQFYIAGAGELPGSAAFSAAALFKPGMDLALAETIFGNRGEASGWRIFTDGLSVSVDMIEGGPATEAVALAAPIAAGDELVHVGFTYDDGVDTLILYVNGVPVDSETDVAGFIPSALAPTIGVDQSGAGDSVANAAIRSLLYGAAYVEGVVLGQTAMLYHARACLAAGRMVDASLQSVYPAALLPTYDHLWDTWFNNSGRNVTPSGGLIVGASTWVDRKTPAINFTRQGASTAPFIIAAY